MVLICVVPGIVYGSPDNALVELIITTHNPACTAGLLHHLEIDRLTDVRPHWRDGVFGYNSDEYERGINITAVVRAYDVNGTIQAIMERPEVRSVAAYVSATLNSTFAEQSVLTRLDTNPDVENGFKECGGISLHSLNMFMDEIGWAGVSKPFQASGPSQASGPTRTPTPLTLDSRPVWHYDESGLLYSGDLLGVEVFTYNVTDTWTLMKRNCALVLYVVDNDGSLGLVSGFVPVSLLWSLSMHDDGWVRVVRSGIERDTVPADRAPAADAGLCQTVRPGTVVTLDGTGSSDPDNRDHLTYLWSQTSGMAVTLSNLTSPTPTFTAPSTNTTITFHLSVTDTASLSSTDTITITVTTAANSPPTVDAGDSLTLASGEQVTLNGTATDPDGDALTYEWLTSPPNAGIVFGSPNSLTTTITAPEVDGTTHIVIILWVSDGIDHDIDEMLLTVTNSTPQ